jgi:hypothetical protein
MDDEKIIKIRNKPLFGFTHMTFLSPGLGDAIGCLNVASKIANEQNIILAISGGSEYITNKLKKCIGLFDIPNVVIREKTINDTCRNFQAWGSDTNWNNQWVKGSGCSMELTYTFIKNKYKLWSGGIKDMVGVSLSAKSCLGKIPITINKKILLNKLLKAGKKIIYFGRTEDDIWLDEYEHKINFLNCDISEEMINKICSCEKFIGVDSGMAWMSVICDVPTDIIVGRGFLEDPLGHSFLPRTFNEIECVKSICWIDDYLRRM